jgi:hypothetical protein
MTGQGGGTPPAFEHPQHPVAGPNGSPVWKSVLSFRANVPPYPVPENFQRDVEWRCSVQCIDGTEAEARLVRGGWDWVRVIAPP